MFLLLCLKVILSLIAKREFILIKNNFLNFSPVPLVLKNILFAKFDEKNIQQSFLVQKL